MKIPGIEPFIAVLLLLTGLSSARAETPGQSHAASDSTQDTRKIDLCARIIRHEDERVVDRELIALLGSSQREIRRRVVMALGRIGDPEGLLPLEEILSKDHDPAMKAMAAFALGQMGNPEAIPSLMDLLKDGPDQTAEVRARAAEAIGKIAANQTPGKECLKGISTALVQLLTRSSSEPSSGDRLVAGSVLTALFRLKDPSTIQAITEQLKSADSSLRFQAASLLSRTRYDISYAVSALEAGLTDSDPLVRAASARALGVARDTHAGAHLSQLLKDKDERVVISSIVALGSIPGPEAVIPLLELGNKLLTRYGVSGHGEQGVASEQNMLLLIATSLGEIKDEHALPFLKTLRSEFARSGAVPEVELALAKFGEKAYFDLPEGFKFASGAWQAVAARAQGLGQLRGRRAGSTLVEMLAEKPDPRAIPDILNSLSALKVEKLRDILLEQLRSEDVVVRSTAAGLLAELSDSSSVVLEALAQALQVAFRDRMNDARLAIMEALSKLKHPVCLQVLTGSTRDPDYIVRRRALELLKESGQAVNLSGLKAGPIETGHDQSYWQRMALLSISADHPTAVIHTRKGAISIELFASDSPMMVDNFIQLSRSGFYDGLTFMRVVPNFVIQGGDPRNDMNGGPGYQVRDEINSHPYLSGTVGIALSGKDTGGSQFFITNMPQPHLDGGYTAIGQVAENMMEKVNSIARGDLIERIEIIQKNKALKKPPDSVQ